MGKKRLVKSLRTPDLRTAQVRRLDAAAWFNAEVDKARAALSPDAVVEQGLEWRARIALVKQGDPAAIGALWGHTEVFDRHGRSMSPKDVALMHAEHALGEHVDHLRETQGDATASLLADVADGRATPLLHHVDAWLREGGQGGPYQPKSARGFRSDLEALAEWAGGAGVAKTIEAFTRAVCGRWVQDRLAAPGANRKTLNRKISAASGYWAWLEKRGHVAANPWARQSLPKTRVPHGEEGKRAFTDAEVVLLLAGGADQELADAMRLGALTGARIEALYQLRDQDCQGGWLIVPPQKKEPGPRRVPVHPALTGIIERRCEGKGAADFLFDEPGTTVRISARSQAASKRFGRYRQRPGVGVHAKRDGVRQSDVTFHSWRRWFITKAEQADQAPHLISAVVGHVEGRKGMTLGHYSGGPSDQQLREVVESVSLPEATQ